MADSATDGPVSRYATFGGDAQLLAELGERLIATTRVALAELVKNSYDADATQVHAWLSTKGGQQLHVRDDGVGMTEQDFLGHWMRIGTTAKLRSATSPRYKRAVTGSKGVGRFAVRRLGKKLQLETRAYPVDSKALQRLTATFDWEAFKPGHDLQTIQIPYSVEAAGLGESPGTHLTIGKLVDDWSPAELQSVTGYVLDVIEPALPGWISDRGTYKGRDPGMGVYFGTPETATRLQAASSEIVERWLARVRVKVGGPGAHVECQYRDIDSGKTRFRESWNARLTESRNLTGPVRVELRYFPSRPGMFSGMGSADGRNARTFIRQHAGVRVIDRGVRLPRYGEPEDDWLNLDARMSRNVRGWESPLTEQIFPEATQVRDGRYSAYLRVPSNHQLLGWVRVESGGAQLEQSMDRRGLVENDAFRQLREIVICAVETIAAVDAEQVREMDKEAARAEAREIRTRLAGAAARIEASPSIPRQEKAGLLKSLSAVSDQLTRQEETQTKSIEAVESVSLLGVLAGFMVHETQTLLDSVREAIERLDTGSSGSSAKQTRAALAESKERLEAFMEYAEYFFKGLPAAEIRPFDPHEQVQSLIKLFENITTKRGIKVLNKIPEDMPSPKVWVGLYTGVALNLLTNSLKAVFPLRQADGKQVLFQAREDGGVHTLQVSDTGLGVAPEVKDFIFQPFVSTTRSAAGPLGSGLGLGLYIVRRALKSANGRIRIVPPPEGYSTTFEVSLPS